MIILGVSQSEKWTLAKSEFCIASSPTTVAGHVGMVSIKAHLDKGSWVASSAEKCGETGSDSSSMASMESLA